MLVICSPGHQGHRGAAAIVFDGRRRRFCSAASGGPMHVERLAANAHVWRLGIRVQRRLGSVAGGGGKRPATGAGVAATGGLWPASRSKQ